MALFPLTPAAKLRFLFYFTFALVGVFHAEVLSRSQPWVLFNPFMFLLVIPVYACHYVVLGDLLLRRRALSFTPVFLAGCILGMYEFVITKMYWNPTWTPFAPKVLDTAWLEVLYIGFFWHAFMSFAVPFFLVRKLVLERHPRPLEIREVRWILIGVPVIAAGFGTAFGAPPLELLASVLLSMLALVAVATMFLREAPALGFRGPDDVLLTPTGRKIAWGFLAFVYLFFGTTMRLDALPGAAGIAIPVILYAALFLMFYPYVRAPDGPPAPPPAQPASPAPATDPASFRALRQFFMYYAAAFVGLVVWFQAVAIFAPWALFLLTLGILVVGGFGAAGLLLVAARRSLREWSALTAAPFPS